MTHWTKSSEPNTRQLQGPDISLEDDAITKPDCSWVHIHVIT